jgi:hypothetical protein
MTSSYIDIPSCGDIHWRAPVATAFDLPTNGNQIGDVRLAIDTAIPYEWTGSAWVLVAGGGGGPPGPPGPPGPAGAPGAVWYNGAVSPPPPAVGINGDYYLNTVDGDVWYKSGGVWL